MLSESLVVVGEVLPLIIVTGIGSGRDAVVVILCLFVGVIRSTVAVGT